MSKCDAYVLQGQTCSQCGREHKPIMPGWMILCGLAILAVGGWLYLYYRKNGTLPTSHKSWVAPGFWDAMEDGWTMRDGTLYPPGDGPR